MAYIYPDMKTLIVGRFKKGQLVSGLEAELNGLTYADNGLLRPLYNIKGQNLMTYSVSNQTWIGSDPFVRDPLEVELVKGCYEKSPSLNQESCIYPPYIFYFLGNGFGDKKELQFHLCCLG